MRRPVKMDGSAAGNCSLRKRVNRALHFRREDIYDLLHEGKPRIWLLAGASAVGKTDAAFGSSLYNPAIYVPPRDITRIPRKGERKGRDHVFRTVEEFEALDKSGFYIHSFKHRGDWVGIERGLIEDHLEHGYDCLLIVANPDTLEDVVDKFPEANTMLLHTHDQGGLLERLRQRMGEDVDASLMTKAFSDFERHESMKEYFDAVFYNEVPFFGLDSMIDNANDKDLVRKRG